MTGLEQHESGLASHQRVSALAVSPEAMHAFFTTQQKSHVNDSNLIPNIYEQCEGGNPLKAQHLSQRELAWKPNANDHSAQAEQWGQERAAHANQNLPLDQNGNYTVQKGDSLSDIARRALLSTGDAHPSNKDIEQRMLQIMKDNKDRYPDLARNQNLIHPGMQFRMSDVCTGDQMQTLPVQAGNGNLGVGGGESKGLQPAAPNPIANSHGQASGDMPATKSVETANQPAKPVDEGFWHHFFRQIGEAEIANPAAFGGF